MSGDGERVRRDALRVWAKGRVEEARAICGEASAPSPDALAVVAAILEVATALREVDDEEDEDTGDDDADDGPRGPEVRPPRDFLVSRNRGVPGIDAGLLP